MASTFDGILDLELIADGEAGSTWGDKTNVNLQKLAQSANALYSISLTGVVTPYDISSTRGSVDEACRQNYKFTGVLSSDLTVRFPARQKRGVVWNATSGGYNLVVGTINTGATVTVPNGGRLDVLSDGTDVVVATTSIGQGNTLNVNSLSVANDVTVGGAITVTGAVSTSALALGTPLAISSGGTGANARTGATMPYGVIAPYAASTPPTGWLVCDGSAISRTTYSALFAVIGTVYGAGDGASTFNIPDCLGRFLVGAGDAAFYRMAQVSQDNTTITFSSIPIRGTARSNPNVLGAGGGKEFATIYDGHMDGALTYPAGYGINNLVGAVNAADPLTNNNLALSVYPPYMTVNWIIHAL